MMTDEQYKELRERNAQRLEVAKEQLGEKYLCHPANFVTRESFAKSQKVTQRMQAKQRARFTA